MGGKGRKQGKGREGGRKRRVRRQEKVIRDKRERKGSNRCNVLLELC